MKLIFTKRFWQLCWNHRRELWPYSVAVFTNRAVVVSLCITLGAWLGISIMRIVQIGVYFTWGAVTLPYTENPIAMLSLILIGGLIGLMVSETPAAKRWLAEKRAEAAAAEAKPQSEPPNLKPLAFDANKGILSYHGKKCKIPGKTYQHLVCAKLFEQPGRHVEEWEILFAVDYERDKADSERLVKDAVYAVSAKAKKAFGIEKALMWEALTAWVNDAYLA